MDSSEFLRYGIKLPSGSRGNTKTICPNCTPHNRKPANRNSKDLSVEVDAGTWQCWNCHWSGSIKTKQYTRPAPIAESKLNLTDQALAWFKGRKISPYTLQRFKIHSDRHWFGQTQSENSCIVFPYYRGDDLVNAKYRDGNKNFALVKDAEKIFFNLDSLSGVKEAVIVEGEIDSLAVYEDGYREGNVSVPNGASDKTNNLEYLDNCWKDFEHLDTIIIATDNDAPGIKLRNDLARRFGKHRCKFVVWPEGIKDMNQALMEGHSPKKLIANAVPFPVDGVVRLMDIEEDLDILYVEGPDPGADTGIEALDEHLHFRKGEFITITGIPGSGKSELIDQVCNRLASRHGYKIAYCSPEKETTIHIGTLMSQFIGANFFSNDSRYKINMDDYQFAKLYIQDHFFFYKFSDVDTTPQGVVDKAIELVKSQGINILVVDPWNYLEHNVPSGMSETQYIGKALDIFLKFAKMYHVCVILVAHPTKIRKLDSGQYDIPTLYSISGSAHFFNKTDNGGSVYRDFFDTNGWVSFFVQKIRNKFVGKIGEVELKYDKFTGRYADRGKDFQSDYLFYVKRMQLDIDTTNFNI